MSATHSKTDVVGRLRSRFLCSSLGQHHLSVREWDESKQMRELVSRCPRGPRSGADVGREVLAGEGGVGGDEVGGGALEDDPAGAGAEVEPRSRAASASPWLDLTSFEHYVWFSFAVVVARHGAGLRGACSAHRSLHKRADLCLFSVGPLLQRKRGRPHGAFVEVRLVAEAERRVPR